jgi:hypothetical protein
MEKYYRTKRRRWNELVDIHVGSDEYNLEGFMAGESSLHRVELEALGDVYPGRNSSTSSAILTSTPSLERGSKPRSPAST